MKKYIVFAALFFTSVSYANEFFNRINNIFFSNTYQESNINTKIFASNRESESENIFIFSPEEHTWAVYNKNGKRVGLGRATGGRDYCQDSKEECRTVVGKFKVFKKEDKDCTSKTYPIDEGGGAPMPYCIFFHKGYAIHGSNNVSNENISHGCVRVSNKAAKWLHDNYIHENSFVLILPYATEKQKA